LERKEKITFYDSSKLQVPVRRRITHCRKPRKAVWLESTMKFCLSSLAELKQISEAQSSLVPGYLNAFEKLGVCSPSVEMMTYLQGWRKARLLA